MVLLVPEPFGFFGFLKYTVSTPLGLMNLDLTKYHDLLSEQIPASLNYFIMVNVDLVNLSI